MSKQFVGLALTSVPLTCCHADLGLCATISCIYRFMGNTVREMTSLELL